MLNKVSRVSVARRSHVRGPVSSGVLKLVQRRHNVNNRILKLRTTGVRKVNGKVVRRHVGKVSGVIRLIKAKQLRNKKGLKHRVAVVAKPAIAKPAPKVVAKSRVGKVVRPVKRV